MKKKRKQLVYKDEMKKNITNRGVASGREVCMTSHIHDGPGRRNCAFRELCKLCKLCSCEDAEQYVDCYSLSPISLISLVYGG